MSGKVRGIVIVPEEPRSSPLSPPHLLVLARIADHREMILPRSVIRRDGQSIDSNEVLGIAYARPTAIMHGACALPLSAHQGEGQKIAVIIVRSHWRP